MDLERNENHSLLPLHRKKNRDTPLIRAIKEGNVDSVDFYIKHGEDVNKGNEFGFTPLMYAAVRGMPEIIVLLIKEGARLEDTNFKGSTALTLAKFNGNVQAYETLLDQGANEEAVLKTAVKHIHFKEGTQYHSEDIIQSATYCENPSIGHKRIRAMINHLQAHAGLYGHFVLTMAALCVLKKEEETGKTLDFFAADGDNLFSLTGNENDVYLLGGYHPSQNMIQMCNSGTYFDSAATFLHELTHKIHLALPDDKFQELIKVTHEFKNHLHQLRSKKMDNEYSNGVEFVYQEMLHRVYMSGFYKHVYLQVLEHVADFTKMEMLAHKEKRDHPKFAEGILFAIEPLRKFWDAELLPQMAEFILLHENRKMVNIPQIIRKELQKHNTVNLSRNQEEKRECKNTTLGQKKIDVKERIAFM